MKLLLGKGRGWTEQSTCRQMISREMHCLELLSALLTLYPTEVPTGPRLTDRFRLRDIKVQSSARYNVGCCRCFQRPLWMYSQFQLV